MKFVVIEGPYPQFLEVLFPRQYIKQTFLNISSFGYRFCEMPDGEFDLEKNKLYFRKEENCFQYKVLNPSGDVAVGVLTTTEIPALKRWFDEESTLGIENLSEVADDILKLTSGRKDTRTATLADVHSMLANDLPRTRWLVGKSRDLVASVDCWYNYPRTQLDYLQGLPEARLFLELACLFFPSWSKYLVQTDDVDFNIQNAKNDFKTAGFGYLATPKDLDAKAPQASASVEKPGLESAACAIAYKGGTDIFVLCHFDKPYAEPEKRCVSMVMPSHCVPEDYDLNDLCGLEEKTGLKFLVFEDFSQVNLRGIIRSEPVTRIISSVLEKGVCYPGRMALLESPPASFCHQYKYSGGALKGTSSTYYDLELLAAYLEAVDVSAFEDIPEYAKVAAAILAKSSEFKANLMNFSASFFEAAQQLYQVLADIRLELAAQEAPVQAAAATAAEAPPEVEAVALVQPEEKKVVQVKRQLQGIMSGLDQVLDGAAARAKAEVMRAAGASKARAQVRAEVSPDALVQAEVKARKEVLDEIESRVQALQEFLKCCKIVSAGSLRSKADVSRALMILGAQYAYWDDIANAHYKLRLFLPGTTKIRPGNIYVMYADSSNTSILYFMKNSADESVQRNITAIDLPKLAQHLREPLIESLQSILPEILKLLVIRGDVPRDLPFIKMSFMESFRVPFRALLAELRQTLPWVTEFDGNPCRSKLMLNTDRYPPKKPPPLPKVLVQAQRNLKLNERFGELRVSLSRFIGQFSSLQNLELPKIFLEYCNRMVGEDQKDSSEALRFLIAAYPVWHGMVTKVSYAEEIRNCVSALLEILKVSLQARVELQEGQVRLVLPNISLLEEIGYQMQSWGASFYSLSTATKTADDRVLGSRDFTATRSAASVSGDSGVAGSSAASSLVPAREDVAEEGCVVVVEARAAAVGEGSAVLAAAAAAAEIEESLAADEVDTAQLVVTPRRRNSF